jgi:hypothetical protein
MRPRRLMRASGRPLNFTVRRRVTALAFLVPVSGGVALTLLYASSLPSNERHWLRSTIAFAVASALANVVVAVRLENSLYRDAFALATVAAFCTVVIGWVGRAFLDKPLFLRLVLAALALVIFAVLAPFIALFAHCTSGDCL